MPTLFEEENWRPETHGMDTETHEVWMPRTVKVYVILWTKTYFHHKIGTVTKSQFPTHSEVGPSEHATAGD